MRINNNIMAMNTHRQYTVNVDSVAKSTEKLSSGSRVNRAGDDAAGLAISEKMRSQIKGLQMASKNSSDAISLVQTAEAALQETHNILQRMRELAVQSASDTNETSIDRAALDAEFQQLIKEIGDTAKKTKFNDMGVIDGSYSGGLSSANINGDVLYKTGAVAGSGNKHWLTPGTAMLDSGTYTFNAISKNGVLSITMQFTPLGATAGSTTATITVASLQLTDAQIKDRDYVVAMGDEIRLQLNDGTAIRFVLPKDSTASDGVVDTADELIAELEALMTGFASGGDVTVGWEGNPLTIQTGANQGDEMRVAVSAMDERLLGLDGTSVATGRDARHAITRVSDATNFVSAQRAVLGGLQNRLNHKIINLDTSAENLAAAESRIRDLDMAKEMSTFTRNNILVQASTSMLAQANSIPQSVLSLLQ